MSDVVLLLEIIGGNNVMGIEDFFGWWKAKFEDGISKVKDLRSKAISKIIKEIMKDRPEINRIAEILELKLEKGSLDLSFQLKGETEPINCSLKYALKENTIYIDNVKTNKEWINALTEIFKEKYSEIDTSVFGDNEDKVKWVINHLF
jgi:hypothetical protein